MSNDNKQEDLTPNKVLMNNIDKHQFVVVIGVTNDGSLHMETNRPTYEFMNYLLNRAVFNINLMETNQRVEAEQLKQAEAENKIAEAVSKNVLEEIENVRPKRGRPRKDV